MLGLIAASSSAHAESVSNWTQTVNGRKRHIAVDILELLLAVSVTAASLQDRDATTELFARARSKSARHVKLLAASAYTGDVVALAASASLVEVEIMKRCDDRPGFVLIPKRWVVERTFGCFNFDRVLAKDYDHTTVSAEGLVQLAGIYQLVQRWVYASHVQFNMLSVSMERCASSVAPRERPEQTLGDSARARRRIDHCTPSTAGTDARSTSTQTKAR